MMGWGGVGWGGSFLFHSWPRDPVRSGKPPKTQENSWFRTMVEKNLSCVAEIREIHASKIPNPKD